MTAGVEKIWHADPRIGFLAQAKNLDAQYPALQEAASKAQGTADPKQIEAAHKALRTNRVLRFNNLLDAGMAGAFLVLVSGVVVLSAREWMLLLGRRKQAQLRETEPVWLPDYAVAEPNPLRAAGLAGLALTLARELSDEAQIERARKVPETCCCECGPQPRNQVADRAETQRLYVQVTEKRFAGVKRCC
jgi:carbon starvation protein